MRRSAAATVPLVLGPSLGGSRRPAGRAALAAFVGPDVLAQARRNVFDLKLAFARRAWANTRAKADGYLGYRPSRPRPTATSTDWWNAIYAPGLHDGNAALTLAIAHAFAEREPYATACEVDLPRLGADVPAAAAAWKIGHMVAEPSGL